MDILFLTQPAGANGGAALDPVAESELQTELEETLTQLDRALHTALMGSHSGAKEARQWLINSVAGLDVPDAARRRRRFSQFLPGGAACRGPEHEPLGRAMLQLLFEAAPGEVGALLARDASLLRRFFKTSPKLVPLWFGHFSMEGMRRFRFGAKALALYSLEHRAEVWHLLAWQGRHPQAPVAVARRTHYFSELDVPRSVRHLVRDCPGFWGSTQMRESVEEGAAQLLALDPPFWSRELLRWLGERGSARGDALHAALCRCLEAGPWRQHCQRLLPLLPRHDLLAFATGLTEGGAPGAQLAFRDVRWPALDELTLAAALGCCLPLLLRLLRDDEMADERQRAERLVRRLLQLDAQPARAAAARAAHWRLRRHLRDARSPAARVALHRMLLLHVFAAAFVAQRLSASDSRDDAEHLQRLLGASGLSCGLEAASRGGSRCGRSATRSKRKRTQHGHGSGKKRKLGSRKRRRQSQSSGSSDADSSGSNSDSESAGAAADLFGGAEVGEEGQQWRWRLQSGAPGGEPAGASSLELLDVVVTAASTAHAAWLFGGSKQQARELH